VDGLTILGTQLPSTLEDISSFILVGREKLVSVRAEIRAIDRLNLAQDVRNQKREEAQMLSEALLDAEVRLGELLKQIPTRSGGDRKSQDFKKGSGAPFEKPQRTEKAPNQTPSNTNDQNFKNASGVGFEKPKAEIVKDLGFSEKQKERFETLADNKDLVEQVKAEARENDDIPTRSRVLDLAQQRKKHEEEAKADDLGTEDYNKYLDFCGKVANHFNKVIYDAAMLNVDDQRIEAWKVLLNDDQVMIQKYIDRISESVPKLLKVQRQLKELIK
jgi:hypothetical protein